MFVYCTQDNIYLWLNRDFSPVSKELHIKPLFSSVSSIDVCNFYKNIFININRHDFTRYGNGSIIKVVLFYNIWKPYLLQWICKWKSQDLHQFMILRIFYYKNGGLLQTIQNLKFSEQYIKFLCLIAKF